MFDAGMNAAVVSPVVVAGDAAGFVAARRGDRWDAAVAPVAEDLVAAGEEVREGVAGDHDVVAVAGPALPDGDDLAAAGADDDLGVNAVAADLARSAD